MSDPIGLSKKERKLLIERMRVAKETEQAAIPQEFLMQEVISKYIGFHNGFLTLQMFFT